MKISTFYKRRLLRVAVPYLLIAGTWYGIKYFIFYPSLTDFIWELSTLSFWFEGKGAWYVAMLIPLYLVYPYFYKWVENGDRNKKLFLSTSSILCVSLILYFVNKDIYTRVVQVSNSYVTFILGYYIGERVMNDGKIPVAMTAFTVLFYPIRALISEIKNIAYLGDLSWAMLGVGFAIVVASFFLNKLPKKVVTVLDWIGGISLELYLTNIFLLQVVAMMREKEVLTFLDMWYECGILYVIVILVGFFLSYMTRFVINSFYKQNSCASQ